MRSKCRMVNDENGSTQKNWLDLPSGWRAGHGSITSWCKDTLRPTGLYGEARLDLII